MTFDWLLQLRKIEVLNLQEFHWICIYISVLSSFSLRHCLNDKPCENCILL